MKSWFEVDKHARGLSPFYWSTPKSPIDLNTGAVYDPQVVSVLTGGTAPPPLNGAPCAPSGLTATGGLLSQHERHAEFRCRWESAFHPGHRQCFLRRRTQWFQHQRPEWTGLRVETSTNLTQWSTVFVTNSPALPFVWTDTNSAVPQRFFRVKPGPPLP